MLNRTLMVLALGIAALSTYAADSLAATTTTKAACVTRPPKVWKSTGGTYGLCINPIIGSIDFEFLADQDFNSITVTVTATSDTVYVRVRNKAGRYPPGQNPKVINGVEFDPVTCTTGPATYNAETGLYGAGCVINLPLDQLPPKSIPKGLIADDIILAGFDVEISVDGLTFRETGTDTTTVHFELPEPPIIGANGTVANTGYSADESESDNTELLYAVSAGGNLLIIDTTTGLGTPINDNDVLYGGLAGQPGQAYALYGTDFPDGNLYGIDLDGQTTPIGPTGFEVTDIAEGLDSDSLYGITFDQFLSIDLESGAGTPIGPLGEGISANALARAPDGNSYYAATSSGDLLQIAPGSGAATVIGQFGPDITSSGDLAFDKAGTLWATVKVTGELNDRLATVNVDTGEATLIGDIGFPDVYGLSFVDADN